MINKICILNQSSNPLCREVKGILFNSKLKKDGNKST